MFQAIEAHPWYNRCKENSKNRVKTLHLEGGYVSLQQWANQPGRFQAARRYESEREQLVGEKRTDNPLTGD